MLGEQFDGVMAVGGSPAVWDEVYDGVPDSGGSPLVLSEEMEVRVVGIRGKQIATGADGIATANLVDGVLSADAAGRAKVATGFFDEATFTDKVSAAAIVAAKLKLVGQTFDFSTAVALRAATPLAATDVANKTYVDNLVNGLSYRPSVDVMFYIGTRTVAQINVLTPSAGWSVVAGDAGTPTAGTSDALAAGDVAEFDGTSWKLIVANSGGFPPAGTRATVAWGTTLYAPLVDAADEGKIAQWGGASLTATLETSLDGWAVLCKGAATNPPTAFNEGRTFAFSGVVPTGSWNQTFANITFGNPVSVGTANAPGSSGDSTRSDHVHAAPKPTTGSKSLAPAPTSGNYSTTGLTAGFTPALGGHVRVVVNGVEYAVGDGHRDNLGSFTNNVACYFSADGGATARAHAAIVSTDTLYWNGTHTGFDLAATDEVSVHGETF